MPRPRRSLPVGVAALALLGLAAGPGCVVKYGQSAEVSPQVAAPPPDLRPLESRIKVLIEDCDEADRRDRLDVLWEYIRTLERLDPAAQRAAYPTLERLIQIDERVRPQEMPLSAVGLGESFAAPGGVEEEELAGPEAPKAPEEAPPEVDLLAPTAQELGREEAPPPPAAEPGPDVDVAALLAEAARLVSAGDPEAAIARLEECRGQPCWEPVQEGFTAARDALVYARKEECARRFLELRGEPDLEVQRTGLRKIQEDLSALRAAWPGSAWAEDLDRHISRVQRELESLPED